MDFTYPDSLIAVKNVIRLPSIQAKRTSYGEYIQNWTTSACISD